MIRNRLYIRLMSQLALFAMLLVVVMPIAHRLMVPASAIFSSGYTDMCTSAGLKSVNSSEIALPNNKLSYDCAYCVIGNMLSALVILFILLLLKVPVLLQSMRPFRLCHHRLHPNGLGSRGPPETIVCYF